MSEATPPLRVWYQSFVDPVEDRPYIDRLRQQLASCAALGIRYEVSGVSPADVASRKGTFAKAPAQAVAEFLGGT